MIPLKRLIPDAALWCALVSPFAFALPARAVAATPAQAVTDTTILAMVNDHPITVRTFRNAYFASPANERPSADSLGRVEYLNSLITKEVLAITAAAVNRPLDFTDRDVLRQNRETTLANILYQRMVEDSVRVCEAEIRAAHAQFARELRLRELRFSDRGTAEGVRRDLIAGRTTWEEAVKNLAIEATEPTWVKRKDVPMQLALGLFDLNPGQISEVFTDADGAHVYQVLERRTVEPPAYQGLRRYLWIELRNAKAYPYVERLNGRLRAEMGVVYDSTNIHWLAEQAGDTRGVKPAAGGATLEVTPTLPDFSEQDLDRVLVRWNDGEVTLRELLPKYTSGSPLMRGTLGNFESVRIELDGMIFGPTMARMAERMGLESDSLAQAVMHRKLEGIQVEHLFRDSVESKVRPTDADARAFYLEHPEYFHSIPSVRYAGIPRQSRDEAMKVYERLRAGEDPAAILLADSLAGRPVGSIQERTATEHGPFQETLFNEMVPGEVQVIGPYGDGSFAVVKRLERRPSERLPYDQVRTEVATAVRNMQLDERLQALVARHSRDMTIVRRPELLMSMSLTDPTNEIITDD